MREGAPERAIGAAIAACTVEADSRQGVRSRDDLDFDLDLDLDLDSGLWGRKSTTCSALALVSLALEQLPLLVFAHLLAPFLDHAAHGITSKSRLGANTDRDSSAESQAFSSRRN